MRGLVTQEGNLAVVDFGRTTEPELTKKQVAAALSRSPRWVELQVRAGMPSRMDGIRRMFLLSECRDWLSKERDSA